MKTIKNALVIALLIVGAGLSGVALAGPNLDWSVEAIENTTPKSLGASYEDFFCYVTDRTGNEDVILSLQVSGLNVRGDARTWVDVVNSTVVNSLTAETTPASWQFQSQDYYARTIRIHVIANTGPFIINGACWPGGR